MDNKTTVRKVLVGVVLEHYIDERYIRDRDEVIPLRDGETDADAIKLWCEEHRGWIKQSEKKYIKIIKEVPLKEYAGHELYRQ